MKTQTAAKFLLSQALTKVESKSIREWAQTERNAPIWLEIAHTAIKNGKNDPAAFAAYIVITAMG